MSDDLRAAVPPEPNTEAVVRNATINLGAKVVPPVLAIVAMPIIARDLGTDRLGVLSLIWVVANFLGLLDLGTNVAVTRHAAENLGRANPALLPKLVWTAVFCQAVCSVIGAAIFLALVPAIAVYISSGSSQYLAESRQSLYLLALVLPPLLVSGPFRSLLEAFQRFDLVNALSLPSSAATFLVPCVLAMLGFRLPGIVVGLAVVRYLVLAAALALAVRVAPGILRPVPPDRLAARSLYGFGAWISADDVLRRVRVTAERFIIAGVGGLRAVAYFSIPVEAILRLGFIPMSLMSAALPAFATLSNQDGERTTRGLDQLLNLLTLVLIAPLALIALLAPELLRLWLGPEFELHSTVVLRIAAVGVLAAWLGGLFTTFLRAIGQPQVCTIFRLGTTPFEIGLLYFLTRAHGVAGAAAALALGHAAHTGCIVLFCYTRYGVPSKAGSLRSGKIAAGVGLSIVAAAGAWRAALRGSAEVALLFAIVAVGLAFGVWRYGLDSAGRSLLLSLMPRRLRGFGLEARIHGSAEYRQPPLRVGGGQKRS